MKRSIPHDSALDSTWALLRDPYGFISKRCRHHDSDLFEARIMLKKTLCMTGGEAAKLFYDPHLFTRIGAVPDRIVKTLFGRGGVQGLDGDEHLQRKRMFMSLMSRERIAELRIAVDKLWDSYAQKWQSLDQVSLYREVQKLLTRAVCDWAGVPLPEEDIGRRTGELGDLFDKAGAIGPAHWRARLSRRRAERWLEGIIEDIRVGRLTPPPQAAASVIAWHSTPQGGMLPPHVAAVELVNVLRPTVAVSAFIVDAAHALHRHPAYRERLGDDDQLEMFVQEVRRVYPFFPWVGARVRSGFDWRGYHLPQGRLVLLDLYGTDHDPRIWQAPEQFRPERFRDRDAGTFGLIPQGGGDPYVNHRCAGEWITIELMKSALRLLALRIRYQVPEQDLELDYRHLPGLPRSRFIIENVTRLRQ